jgi:nitrite reductase/ring-hydroxylating ferredoxin subunit
MGLAAFTAPIAARANAAENPTTALQDAPKPKPKPKPKAKGKGTATAKLVKASNTPLASTEDIPVNSGMLFEVDEYIVTQPKAGKFIGFDSLCTHEGCPIDAFDTPGEMDCTCHDSKFKLDSGKPFAGPAKKPVPKKPIIVENGQIYKAKPAK